MKQVEEVFEFWKEVLSNARSRIDEKRRRAIAARLRDGYSVEDLKMAILGCKASDFHNGQNDRHKRYVSIELICRDADHVDQFIELAERTASSQLNIERSKEGSIQQQASPRSAETEAKIQAMMRKFGVRGHANAH